MKIGIIGFGDFGKLCVKHLSGVADTVVASRSSSNAGAIEKAGARFVALDDLARSCDVVVLAVPLSAYEALLREVCPLMPDGALLVDTCSVKLEPRRLMLHYARPAVDVLTTHPLFGPQTAHQSLAGHKIVLDFVRVAHRATITRFLESFGLEVVELSADEHDREMAWVQALTFFVGRGVSTLRPPDSKLGTNYYGELMDLVDLDRLQSEDLFMTVERGNPYAAKMRQRLIGQLKDLDASIEGETRLK